MPGVRLLSLIFQTERGLAAIGRRAAFYSPSWMLPLRCAAALRDILGEVSRTSSGSLRGGQPALNGLIAAAAEQVIGADRESARMPSDSLKASAVACADGSIPALGPPERAGMRTREFHLLALRAV